MDVGWGEVLRRVRAIEDAARGESILSLRAAYSDWCRLGEPWRIKTRERAVGAFHDGWKRIAPAAKARGERLWPN